MIGGARPNCSRGARGAADAVAAVVSGACCLYSLACEMAASSMPTEAEILSLVVSGLLHARAPTPAFNLHDHWMLAGAVLTAARAVPQAHGATSVEVGSFAGHTTLFTAGLYAQLGLGGVDGAVHAVDASLRLYGTDWGLRKNVARSPLSESVHFHPVKSKDMRPWSTPLRLFFEDSAHTYDVTKDSFDVFEPHLVPGGILVIGAPGSSPTPVCCASRAVPLSCCASLVSRPPRILKSSPWPTDSHAGPAPSACYLRAVPGDARCRLLRRRVPGTHALPTRARPRSPVRLPRAHVPRAAQLGRPATRRGAGDPARAQPFPRGAARVSAPAPTELRQGEAVCHYLREGRLLVRGWLHVEPLPQRARLSASGQSRVGREWGVRPPHDFLAGDRMTGRSVRAAARAL